VPERTGDIPALDSDINSEREFFKNSPLEAFAFNRFIFVRVANINLSESQNSISDFIYKQKHYQ